MALTPRSWCSDWMKLVSHLYLQVDKVEDAKTLLEALRHLQTDDLECLRMLAFVYLKTNDVDQAYKIVHQIRQLPEFSEDHWPFIHLLESRIHLARDEKDLAAISLKRFVRMRSIDELTGS
ncbi:type III secretion apparatus assembly chaperone SctY [Algicola sagamiensis]|uniref:type III secretion apparatus assembly chaperone SctY n=1 Tax=Algicola sagamiensis TaxID=163869 RepID=UPI00035D124E|nr:tetratricopeptide repeat protein [Algicola sagamiensis]